ncbi:MAG: hypothetical protein ACR2N2_11525 [Acidimicrobiia bacterium]
MSELDRQLRSYAEQLDASAPSLEELELRASSPEPSRAGRIPTWVAVAGAAAVVVIAIGSAALFSSIRGDSVEEVSATTTVTDVAPSTTVDVPPTTAVPVFSESPYVSLVSDTPAYAGGAEGDVGGHPMVDAGPIVINAAGYHTLFAAGGEDETWDAVFYARSDDGNTWSVQQEPVSMPGIEGASALVVQSLLQLEDGSWMTFFHVAHDVGGHGAHIFEYEIRSATASSPEGPWLVSPDALLLPDPASWDSYAVTNPNVFITDEEWVMFYTGHAKEPKDGEEVPEGVVGSAAIGIARSSDGASWAKEELPVFTGDPASTWEEGAATNGTVATTPEGWILLYAGRTGGSRGMAVSSDGVGWQRVSEQPVLTALDLPRPAIFTVSLIDDAGDLRLYVSNGGRRTTSSVYEMELLLNP